MNVQRLRLIVQSICFILLVYGGYFAFDIGNRLPTFSCAFVEGKGGGCFLIALQHRMAQPIPMLLM